MPIFKMSEPKQDEPRLTPEDDPSDAPAPSRLHPSDLTPPEETPPPSSRDDKDTEVNMSDTLKLEEDEDKNAAEEQREFLQVHAVVHEEAVIDEENASEAADANAPPSSSSSSFVIPELRLDRSFSADGLSTPGTDEEYDEDDEDEEDEEDEEEEDSDDNFLDRRDSGKRRSMVEATSCEKHAGGLSVQNSLRRRTHSEGSLLQDPRTTCFTSDNAINCMEASGTLLSPKTMKKELTKNGGSMHQLYMLFSGRKLSGASECSCTVGSDGTKKKTSKNLWYLEHLILLKVVLDLKSLRSTVRKGRKDLKKSSGSS
ncbi:Regulator of G-protein signaling 3 [Triplophysa tibetana]|uniref:Regulator of G-protein signaling 3 n=1 Tax=Triplophysa tibetana TaxID=1572043 RepID=A0A5A9P2M7_9TELE|nr:Regulator of G-protein signaling 3 [Triplophysa tibetana]